MASLKELKDRISSVKSTQKITKAKQMVAAAKLRKAQAAAEAARPYAERLETVMSSLASGVSISKDTPKLLAGTGKNQKHLMVVATSDRGLCGAFNANIVKEARIKADALKAEGKDVEFYLVGKKGKPVINRVYPGSIRHHFDTSDIKNPHYDDAKEIAEDLVARMEKGDFDIAWLFYSKFKSALVQEPQTQQIIPVPVDENADTGSTVAVEYEPDEEEILSELLPRNLSIQLFRALLENGASEQGASMTAMDNATRNAGDLIEKLTIVYNRSRQAAITTELVEIISGAEAL
ncbi:F0F1 ATP synthase subunit gamma [Parasphingopyxis lamellibrachiae]|uniref:ATP synthase gamma chain n=1 Tax=Parasphingopyxis lamellibrachiae TaxID=680125 RepID=A0A3D9FBG1_9SPHN|nr:F0F1 ATP synthase subunit gamma [Parasphingopyxis lamellibrachiae]RED15169.1 ATP synthase F1 subcomplex gamma subunit [Parasphingopyxis lamellibrachiae]